MNEVNERNLAEGLFRGVVLIADYMKEANQNLLDTLMDPSERETAMHGSFLRAASWMMSLKKLKHPSDVQAIGHVQPVAARNHSGHHPALQG